MENKAHAMAAGAFLLLVTALLALLAIWLTRDRSAPVTKSTYAIVASQGVTGLGFIQLNDEGESTERLPPNDDDPPRIPLKPGGLDKLLRQSDMILTQVALACIRLNRLLSEENQQAV